MTRVAAEGQWLRRIAGLTVEPDGDWPDDQILAAKLLVVHLVCAARALAASPAAGRAASPSAAALADELARADVPEFPHLDPPPAAEIADRYEQALRNATGAVYFCRRTEHASGRCLFSAAGPGADVCGRVLTAGHRSACAR